MSIDKNKMIKELTTDYLAYIDSFDSSLSEIVHLIFEKHKKSVEGGVISVTEALKLLQDAMINDKIKAAMMKANISLLKLITTFTFIEALEHKTHGSCMGEFYLGFIMRLKALNYPYFVAAQDQIDKTESELKAQHDLVMMEEKEKAATH